LKLQHYIESAAAFSWWQSLRQSITPTSIHPSRPLLQLLLLLRALLSDYRDAVTVPCAVRRRRRSRSVHTKRYYLGHFTCPPVLIVITQSRRR